MSTDGVASGHCLFVCRFPLGMIRKGGSRESLNHNYSMSTNLVISKHWWGHERTLKEDTWTGVRKGPSRPLHHHHQQARSQLCGPMANQLINWVVVTMEIKTDRMNESNNDENDNKKRLNSTMLNSKRERLLMIHCMRLYWWKRIDNYWSNEFVRVTRRIRHQTTAKTIIQYDQ